MNIAGRKMNHQEAWLVIVSYELWVEGFESGLPGILAILVYKVDDNWYLGMEDMPQNNPDLLEQAVAILEKAEVVDKFSECNQKYYEILEENENLREWTMELEDKMTKAIVEGLVEETIDDNDDAAQKEAEMESYVVKKGDCLWRIAEKKMKSGVCWKELYELNKESIGDNPNLILPGEKLQIPTL